MSSVSTKNVHVCSSDECLWATLSWVGSGRRRFTNESSLPQRTEHEMSETTPTGALFWAAILKKGHPEM